MTPQNRSRGCMALVLYLLFTLVVAVVAVVVVVAVAGADYPLGTLGPGLGAPRPQGAPKNFGKIIFLVFEH